MNTPMVIHLYDKNDEEIAVFSRSFIPWKVLKKAVKLIKQIDLEELKEEDIDLIAGLITEVFGDQFTVEQLDEGADLGEMIAVLQNVIARTNGISLNPTPPAS